ncbi:hypothetical protein BB560_004119 [Smittium megazygosporum]|uniref:cyclin-dependent kinase n=1 Tax=Smittium megazygosporum TaxID=133381 RepID=A0A2T9ZA56_9FUNG|nr:hypothetical protein BB560_004119 [Smittium megazygosporum]
MRKRFSALKEKSFSSRLKSKNVFKSSSLQKDDPEHSSNSDSNSKSYSRLKTKYHSIDENKENIRKAIKNEEPYPADSLPTRKNEVNKHAQNSPLNSNINKEKKDLKPQQNNETSISSFCSNNYESKRYLEGSIERNGDYSRKNSSKEHDSEYEKEYRQRKNDEECYSSRDYDRKYTNSQMSGRSDRYEDYREKSRKDGKSYSKGPEKYYKEKYNRDYNDRYYRKSYENRRSSEYYGKNDYYNKEKYSNDGDRYRRQSSGYREYNDQRHRYSDDYRKYYESRPDMKNYDSKNRHYDRYAPSKRNSNEYTSKPRRRDRSNSTDRDSRNGKRIKSSRDDNDSYEDRNEEKVPGATEDNEDVYSRTYLESGKTTSLHRLLRKSEEAKRKRDAALATEESKPVISDFSTSLKPLGVGSTAKEDIDKGSTSLNIDKEPKQSESGKVHGLSGDVSNSITGPPNEHQLKSSNFPSTDAQPESLSKDSSSNYPGLSISSANNLHVQSHPPSLNNVPIPQHLPLPPPPLPPSSISLSHSIIHFPMNDLPPPPPIINTKSQPFLSTPILSSLRYYPLPSVSGSFPSFPNNLSNSFSISDHSSRPTSYHRLSNDPIPLNYETDFRNDTPARPNLDKSGLYVSKSHDSLDKDSRNMTQPRYKKESRDLNSNEHSAKDACENDPFLSDLNNDLDLERSGSKDLKIRPSDTRGPPTPLSGVLNSLHKYEMLTQVGEGTYGKVYKAKIIETGRTVALKRIKIEFEREGFPVTAMREIKLMRKLDHPNITKLIDVIQTESDVYMVMEYMEYDLSGLLAFPDFKLKPENIKSLMQQMLSGLEFMHRNQVIHRDIKGSNILVTSTGQIKYVDFGLARLAHNNDKLHHTNRVITLWYRPPELLLGSTEYGFEVDIWSLGCIMAEMYMKKPMFQGQNEISTLSQIFSLLGPPVKTDEEGNMEAEYNGSNLSEIILEFYYNLPWLSLMNPKKTLHLGNSKSTKKKYKKNFMEILSKHMDLGAMRLLSRMLELEPFKRPTAKECLEDDYFTLDLPHPVAPSEFPKKDYHEFESKAERRKSKRVGSKAP